MFCDLTCVLFRLVIFVAFPLSCSSLRVCLVCLGAECCVCIPRGTHPVVKRFLALHKNLFPIKALRDLDNDRVNNTGLSIHII